MSQSEIVQALKNLGNKALLKDLVDEYFRIHYPDPKQRKAMIEGRNYKMSNALSSYLAKLRREGIISSKLVPVLIDMNIVIKSEMEYTLLIR